VNVYLSHVVYVNVAKVQFKNMIVVLSRSSQQTVY